MKYNLKDLTGQKFGRLTVISYYKENNKTIWKCICDCGNMKNVSGGNLKSGDVKSCGCLRREILTIDITGEKYGMLTVIKQNGHGKSGRIVWLCKCDCGNVVSVRGNDLRTGRTISCGCYKRAITSITKTTHGDSGKRLYNIWRDVVRRCKDKNNPRNKNYGMRGIDICCEWANSYESFKEWSLYNGYADNLSIDRINNNGDYKPTNCRWTTRKVQNNNKRVNRLLTHNGETLSIKLWAEKIHMNYQTLVGRINKKWPVEKSLTEPIHNTKQNRPL
jgi:hypothetical protein